MFKGLSVPGPLALNRLASLRLFAVAAAVVAVFALKAGGQMRVAPIDTMAGHAALGLALRHLSNTGIYMMATAHPDDENNGLLVLLNRGLGFRTTLATATRGNGGQNEIGPELFEALGVLRTAELAALHRFDGAEQYFTRAVDFGYTIDIPETMAKWGRDEIIGDYVRLIRTIRPDVISAQSPNATGPGQHAHHASAAILSREAYKLAGDASKYPEQLREGLRVWQPKKFYNAGGQGSVGFAEAGAANATPAEPQRACRVALDGFDGLLGRTYSEIGTEARSMHKCQGQAQLLALPASSTTALQLTETTIAGQMDRDERSLFDGIDYSIGGLARFAGAQPPAALVEGLGNIAAAAELAQRRFETEGDQATVPTLLTGLRALKTLETRLSSLPIDEAARFEIQFRLAQKSREFQQAILIANAVRIETLADDGVVVPGQPLRVNLLVANRGAAEFTVKTVKVNGLAAATACTLTANGGRGGGRTGGGARAAGPGRAGAGTGAAPAGAPPARGRAADPAATGAARGNAAGGAPGRGGAPAARGGGGRGRGNPAPDPAVSSFATNQVAGCTISGTVPADARITEPYWHRAGDAGRYTFDADATFGLPQRPSPFSADVTLAFASGEEVTASQPVEYRYQGDIFSGEKRTELLVVPALSVRVAPDVLIVPTSTTVSTATTTARTAADRDIRVTVINDGEAAADSVVKLGLPSGWIAIPAEQPVKFTRTDESQTVSFRVRPPRGVAAGSFSITATATAAGASYDRGFQIIEYPHIRRQHIFESARVAVKVFDVKTSPNLSVGYIMGAGDEGPAALEQIGAKVTMLGADDLASGNLASFAAIVTGVRAYEKRDDLIANNSRLLQYVSNGGTLIVQYNRAAFNNAQYGPYPAQVSDDRVTDEHAPVTLLVPAHPLFTTPNRITQQAWDGWVQERGLQFLGERDARYRDLVELEDTFANNPGKKRGALVEAQYGRGRWIYLGLGLWRELPAGVEGAYELLANLVSLGH